MPGYTFPGNEYTYSYNSSKTLSYFVMLRPCATNGNSLINGLAEAVHFSASHGVYNTPLKLILTTPTAGANIRYTVNGSEPTLSNGLDYTNGVNGLTITQTVVIRAAAFKANLVSSIVESRTYIFVEST